MADAEKSDWECAIERARAYAPFLARALDRQPDLATLLANGDQDAVFEWVRLQGVHEDTGIALRRERLGLATALAIGDLVGALPLYKVVAKLTGFADDALDRAIRTAISERTGDDNPSGFIALALGKQGAGELNYSSDIDPIFLYDPDTITRRSSDDPAEAAQRYARRILELLSQGTAEGYVLRVDLRLRPASEISPLVVPRARALAHYQSEALAWERAAFIRARAAAGDLAAGNAFLTAIRPFIWRSHLDFGALEEIRALTARIRDSYEGAERPGPGFDVKKGRGGIREVEFFAQTHQLIHGGRDPWLRVRGTRTALDVLAESERIGEDEARVLGEGYDRLRVIEHRLQMMNDRQTHTLPDGDALDSVAQLDGLADGAALVSELEALTERTGAIYDGLIGAATSQQAMPTPLPKRDPLAARFETWRDGRYQSLRSPQALAAFDAIAPVLAQGFAKADDPERALTRWESLLSRAPSAINLFHLLRAEPALLTRLLDTLTLAPTLSDELARRPELLDAMLDNDALELPGVVTQIAARFEASAKREDYEALLDAIRSETGELRFTLGVQMIEGLADPLSISSALSRVAEAALELAVRAAHNEFAKVHGWIVDSELLVVGLGRLGGGALTHASDLDIIYLFTGDTSAQSNGERPLSTSAYYNRLASRVSAALSVPTAQGALYEVDTRLRPQGKQGPLAVSCEAFAKYQREAAWTWEHMALARARVLVGSDEARAQLDAIMAEVLQRPRDGETVRKRVTDMRSDMARHKQPRGLLDVKLQRGGLVDAEFAVHFLQLRDGPELGDKHPAALDPDLGTAIPALIRAGLLPPDFKPAYDLMTRLLVAARLLAPGGKEPPACAQPALAKACQASDYDTLLQDLTQARQRVAGVWSTILGQSIA
ncbi:MAG: bifunctional [glutamate--ammonia ligase]-adenylyl-L-tyrosine phosphorylase/[glutamate--ammonia-ligase] adenylyltransferase [Erythrobacter sp.]